MHHPDQALEAAWAGSSNGQRLLTTVESISGELKAGSQTRTRSARAILDAAGWSLSAPSSEAGEAEGRAVRPCGQPVDHILAGGILQAACAGGWAGRKARSLLGRKKPNGPKGLARIKSLGSVALDERD
jgi:hypothetical protein